MTVTVEPSVGALPTFETASVNVVGWPATRLPVWLLAIVRRRGDRVDHLRRGVGERSPERETGERRGRLVDDLLAGRVVRVDLDVERHRVRLARRDPSPGRRIPAGAEPEHHLPGARVELGRVVAQRIGWARRRLRTGSDAEAARNVVDPGRDRVAHHEVGGGVRARVRVRNRVAQHVAAPIRSAGMGDVGDRFELVMLGANRSVANVTTAGKYVSPLVVTTMLAEVALFGRIPFALTSFESYAQLLNRWDSGS